MIGFDWHVRELLVTEDHLPGSGGPVCSPRGQGDPDLVTPLYPFKVGKLCLSKLDLPCSHFKTILLLLNFVEAKGNSNVSLEDCPIPYRGRGQYL